jgi:murein L,D-transpeptidase YafK
MNQLVVFLLGLIIASVTLAQKPFIENQKSFPRVHTALSSKNDILKKAYEDKHLQWPPKQIYLRSFKYDSKLEVWARNSMADTFSLFKTYKVCALSGSLGPKRIVGDYQVPEGFYYVNFGCTKYFKTQKFLKN